MTSIAGVDSAVVRELKDALGGVIPPDASLETASQACASALYERFQSSVALVRVLATVPLADLPSRERAFALAAAGTGAADLHAKSPILTLLGTRGADPAWNDRRQSSGHVALPVGSPAFVAEAPMITRLFRELGADVKTPDEDVQRVVERVIGGSLAGVFLVEEAKDAVDQRGRKIIPAQDFVSRHRIRSVFGVGGTYVAGSLVVIIFFTTEPVARSAADLFTRYVSSFKKHTMRAVMEGRIFEQKSVRNPAAR